MSPTTLVQVDCHDRIATLTMSDGKANVMSVNMLRALNEALDKAQAERAVLVLTGLGRSFSGGFDLAAFNHDPHELAQMLEGGARLAARLLAYPHPVIAACNGHAVAMGAFLLLCADVRLCADDELRIQLNEVQVGLTMPRFAMALCRQRLTPGALHAAVTTARPYSPTQAVSAGFIDDVVAPAALLSTALAQAQSLAALPASAFEATKQRLGQDDRLALDKAIDADVAEWTARARSTA